MTEKKNQEFQSIDGVFKKADSIRMAIYRLLPLLSLIPKLHRKILGDSQIYLPLFLYHWFQ